MKIILIPLLIMAVLGACSTHHQSSVETEYKFANKLAVEGLWKEALYRWNKALANGKNNAAIYNNMAVALEKMGRFEEAATNYKKALAIAPESSTIQGNYDKLTKYLKNEDDPEVTMEKDEKDDVKKKRGKKDEESL